MHCVFCPPPSLPLTTITPAASGFHSSDRLRYAHMVGAQSTESYEIASVTVAGLTDNRCIAAKQALLTA